MELRGNLKDFSLPDIIQLVGFGRKTGVLRVECENGGAALYFEDGDVVHAVNCGLEGEKAVYALFCVPDGEFRFQTEIEPPGRTISMDPTNLIMEAARLLDESRREPESSPEFSEFSENALEESLSFASRTAEESFEESKGDWFGADQPEPPPLQGADQPEPSPLQKDPEEIKKEIEVLLKRRFGRQARRLLKAVNECGNSIEELLVLAERVEKFVHVFIDTSISQSIGEKVREIITG